MIHFTSIFALVLKTKVYRNIFEKLDSVHLTFYKIRLLIIFTLHIFICVFIFLSSIFVRFTDKLGLIEIIIYGLMAEVDINYYIRLEDASNLSSSGFDRQHFLIVNIP